MSSSCIVLFPKVSIYNNTHSDQSVPAVLVGSSPFEVRTQTQDTDVIQISLDQLQHEKAADKVREAEGGNSEPEQAEPAENLTHEGEAANIGSHTQPPIAELTVKS